jgi:hypothetical protein
MSATPVPSYPLRRMARAATDTMRSWVASFAAALAFEVGFRMIIIIYKSDDVCKPVRLSRKLAGASQIYTTGQVRMAA